MHKKKKRRSELWCKLLREDLKNQGGGSRGQGPFLLRHLNDPPLDKKRKKQK